MPPLQKKFFPVKLSLYPLLPSGPPSLWDWEGGAEVNKLEPLVPLQQPPRPLSRYPPQMYASAHAVPRETGPLREGCFAALDSPVMALRQSSEKGSTERQRVLGMQWDPSGLCVGFMAKSIGLWGTCGGHTIDEGNQRGPSGCTALLEVPVGLRRGNLGPWGLGPRQSNRGTGTPSLTVGPNLLRRGGERGYHTHPSAPQRSPPPHAYPCWIALCSLRTCDTPGSEARSKMNV